MNAEFAARLEEKGYILLRDVLCEDEVRRLVLRLEELWEDEGERAGEENYFERGARRLANLVNKGDIFRAIVMHPLILEAVEQVVGTEVRLSMLNARDALPDADLEQPLHADTDHGGKPDEKGYYVCTAVWMLDDFTKENGATRLVPGSHRFNALPKEVLRDVFAPHPGEVIVEGRAGDVLVFNGHCWHSGRRNWTVRSRRALLAHYIRADHPQRLNQKQSLSPDVQARMSPREREILGLEG